ncbi:MAG: acyltransferase family protein [Candidatus Bathyarchaeota archaeon]|nr:acyltransferase family protein [Candidatus Termiticorpusculum sp.]
MDKQNGTSAIPVDLIRVVAISAVLLLHAISNLATQPIINMGMLHWWVVVDIYQSFGRMGVPLFLMLSGALLLAPSKKDEQIDYFFKKRFSRIGLPFLFWSIIYFIWAFYITNTPFTQDFIINGILKGPYVTFWYIYMLIGLYLLTPLLRVMVANFTAKHFKYFIILWIIGAALIPMAEFISGWQTYLNGIVLLIPLCVGYFIAGAYLIKIRIKRWILTASTVLGFTLTIIITYFTAGNGGDTAFFFQGNNSPTMILTTVSLFLLLNSYTKPQNVSQPEIFSWKQRIMHVISKNSLAIYLCHMIAFYILKTVFVFVLNGYIIDAIIDVPLTAILTLLLSLFIIIPLKKIPGLKHFIG